jgi:hypothetical protein
MYVSQVWMNLYSVIHAAGPVFLENYWGRGHSKKEIVRNEGIGYTVHGGG